MLFTAIRRLLLLSLLPVSAQAASIDEQRSQFRTAEQQLNANQRASYAPLAESLRPYPLYPYLVYNEINTRIHKASASEVNDFARRYADSPLGPRLYENWLGALARNKDWKAFLESYQGQNSTALQCYYLEALFRTGESAKAARSMPQLWLTGKSLPASCNNVTTLWQADNSYTASYAWQRLGLAMDNGNSDLASSLLKNIAPEQRPLAALWLTMKDAPKQGLADPLLQTDTSETRQLVSYGVKRLARLDFREAMNSWPQLRSRYRFSSAESQEIERRIALALMLQRDPPEKNIIDPLIINANDASLQEWRIRMALRAGDWQEVLAWIDRLPPADQRDIPTWRYWRARALEASGIDKAQARAIYLEMSRDVSYYGFSAADRLQTGYRIKHNAISYSTNALTQVEALPGILRARELYMLGRLPEARLEWSFAIRKLDTEQLLHAAKLARDWGWNDRAMRTLERTPYNDVLDITYPIILDDHVIGEARSNQIDPAWAYAIMRQESTFMPDAKSSVGAMGLMQIMPETGKMLADILKAPLESINRLLDERLNISFGIRYLKMGLDRFEGNQALATAGYNAGGGRVKTWIPKDKAVEADVWIDTIPFKETRNYVRKVMGNTVVYDYRLGNTPIPLNKRIAPIGKVNSKP